MRVKHVADLKENDHVFFVGNVRDFSNAGNAINGKRLLLDSARIGPNEGFVLVHSVNDVNSDETNEALNKGIKTPSHQRRNRSLNIQRKSKQGLSRGAIEECIGLASVPLPR